jgi:hypothetical protein
VPETTSPLCAFCKRGRPSTKEHLWPASLHSRLILANQQAQSSFWLKRLKRELPSEPQIRDVCAECNNTKLSILDSYICDLFDRFFVTILERYQQVEFDYDYHLLKRWLLKVSYNSARIHQSFDLDAIAALLPYILEGDYRAGRNTDLFIQLNFPESVDPREIDPDSTDTDPIHVPPDSHRIGHVLVRAHGRKKILRAVHLRSYSFFVAFWLPAGSRSEREEFKADLPRILPGSLLLSPTRSAATAVCNGVGAWVSIRDSRTTDFVFDTDA